MRRSLLTLLPVLPALFALAGCAAAPENDAFDEEETGGEKTYKTNTKHTYEKYFQTAAKEYGVPAHLLIAMGYTETHLYHVMGETAEFEGIEPAWGVMALRGEVLERGAELAGLDPMAVRNDTEANIKAAAALLDAYADEMGIDREDLGAWAPAAAAYMDHPNAMAKAHYVHDEVYRVLREGIAAAADSGMGDILEATPDVVANYPNPQPYSSGYVPKKVYSGAIWRPAPSSNYTTGRSYGVELLVVHTCAGGYSGCWGWLNTPYPQNPYKTSAHYVVNESGSQISALVDEVDTAHHVGKSWKGYPTNPRSVGIEHGGFSYSGSNKWTEGQIAASAKLACDVVKRHNIIRDRNHIIGHYQPDPVNRANDPGTNFPWADYMNRIEMCVTGSPAGGGGSGGGDGGGSGGGDGGGDGGLVITVDSNNGNNNASLARMVATSSNWKASSNVQGFYGSGYWVAPTQAVSDGAHFEFYMPAAGQKTIYAWWTSASDRSTATPFVVFDAAGNKLGSVTKNQQTGGGSWQKIGTYNFTAGWNRVTVSRWAATGYQVVADAIQVR